jgi:hypothetical protein
MIINRENVKMLLYFDHDGDMFYFASWVGTSDEELRLVVVSNFFQGTRKQYCFGKMISILVVVVRV